MINRRDVLVASATALAGSTFTSTKSSALAQGVTVPGTMRGFLDRPGCRIYYEITGLGPAIIFAHGLGSNHLTWWQQISHFSDRYTCVTFGHRGYPPGSEIGVPDPKDFAGDLATLIAHLNLPDVRLVAHPWAVGPAWNTFSPIRITRCAPSYSRRRAERYTSRPYRWATRNV